MRTIRGAQIWRWRHVAKVQKQRGWDGLRRMMHLQPLPTTVRTDLPAVRRAIAASQNRTNRSAEHSRQTAGPSPSKPTNTETSSGGEHA